MNVIHENRILFLKKFAQELILNSIPAEILMIKHEEAPVKLVPSLPFLHLEEKPKPAFNFPKPAFYPQARSQQFLNIRREIHPEMKTMAVLQPEPIPAGFALGKLDFLVKDAKVNAIECSGPGKLILAKSLGMSSVTKVSLTDNEIQEIIEKFSQQSRIPVMSGLFKAAVGNLIITAVISDFLGSRFIIEKMSGFPGRY